MSQIHFSHNLQAALRLDPDEQLAYIHRLAAHCHELRQVVQQLREAEAAAARHLPAGEGMAASEPECEMRERFNEGMNGAVCDLFAQIERAGQLAVQLPAWQEWLRLRRELFEDDGLGWLRNNPDEPWTELHPLPNAPETTA